MNGSAGFTATGHNRGSQGQGGKEGGREAVARVQDKAGHRSIWAGSRPYLVRVPPVARPTSRPPRTGRLRLSGGARSWTRTLEQGID